jgi:nicotinate dehydrogenase subunit B
MNAQPFVFDFLSEPERYELHENLWDDVSRRDFFRIAGAGVVVALLFHEKPAIAQQRGGQRGGQASQELGAWLHIGEDSAITAYTGKVEIGQNIRTSFTQVIAEELHVPVGRIRMVMADTELVPFDGGTAGSQSTPMMASQLRRVAASAREVLLDLAAEQGKVERKTLTVKDGKIAGPDGKPSFEFGELTKGKKLLKTINQNAKSVPAADWKVEGTSVPKVDGPDFVTGKHQYASDIKRPGMLFGKVLRPPSFKATLVNGSLQTKDAEAMPGVTVVHDGDFIGVVAPTEHAAEKALAAIKAEWKTVAQPSWEELSKYLKEHRGGGGGGRGGGGGGKGGGGSGSVKEGLRIADFKVEATYPIAFIAHFPLEPRAAVAEFGEAGKLTVWTGSQRPFGVRGEVASAVGLAPEKVRVIIPDMGSGYGGKHTGEAAVEAARLAKAAKKPVKLVWTREEEFTWAYFRPGGVIDISAGVKKDGALVAWEAHNYNSGASALQTPYEVTNRTSEFHGSDSPLRQGSYRALASTANNFARESHMDDLAHAVQMDPLAFRLKNLKHERLRGVLEAAAKQFGWGKLKPQEGHGFGLALGTEKNSFVATCAEVAADVKTGRVKVIRVVTAFDCGAVLNPDHLKNQIEGATMMGLGGALYEVIQFANGEILNPNLAGYKVARFADTPSFETVLMDRKDVASAGAGETPIIGIGPAVGNAIFQATGIRLRSLPMVPNGLKAG